MISRRNIRIKAMQALYGAMNSSESWTAVDAKKLMNVYYKNAKSLTIAYLELTKQILEYCIIDSENRKSKHLPTAADLNVNIKSANNSFLKQLHGNESFIKAIDEFRINYIWETDDVKQLYQELEITPDFKQYISKETPTIEEDTAIFNLALDIAVNSSDIESLLEDGNCNLNDDIEMVALWIVKNQHQLKDIDFMNLLSREKHNFGIDLIDTVAEKQSYTLELITPKLMNWDPERIAKLDMLIMQMGLTELLYFPNIPTKVSINEYIDLAKLYSTKQSGHFVNGVLDKIHKQLIKEDKIEKIPLQK
jgi:transcription antitermination protein NusB